MTPSELETYYEKIFYDILRSNDKTADFKVLVINPKSGNDINVYQAIIEDIKLTLIKEKLVSSDFFTTTSRSEYFVNYRLFIIKILDDLCCKRFRMTKMCKFLFDMNRTMYYHYAKKYMHLSLYDELKKEFPIFESKAKPIIEKILNKHLCQ